MKNANRQSAIGNWKCLGADMVKDLSFALRMLRKSPGFTAVAVLSLALGIGANTAIFQLLDAVRLKTLPVKAPQELAEVRIADMTGARGSFSTRYDSRYQSDMGAAERSATRVLRSSPRGVPVRSISRRAAKRVRPKRSGLVATFSMCWVCHPSLGRVFAPGDDQRGCSAPGVVISHAFWQKEYGGDVGVLGPKNYARQSSFRNRRRHARKFLRMEVGRSFDLALPICADAIVSGS